METNEKRSLYCYRFLESTDTNNSSLERIVIDEWHLSKGLCRSVYKFKANYLYRKGGNYTLLEDKLDRFVNGKIFTFNPDPNFAIETISKQLKDDVVAAQVKLNRAEDRWKCWLELQASITKFKCKYI